MESRSGGGIANEYRQEERQAEEKKKTERGIVGLAAIDDYWLPRNNYKLNLPQKWITKKPLFIKGYDIYDVWYFCSFTLFIMYFILIPAGIIEESHY